MIFGTQTAGTVSPTYGVIDPEAVAIQAAVKLSGLDRDLIPEELLEGTLGQVRYNLAAHSLVVAGFEPEEIKLLVPTDRDKLGEAGFKSAIRRARSGAKVLASRFLKVLREGRVLRFGAMPSNVTHAFGDLELVGIVGLETQITGGKFILFRSEQQLTRVRNQWKRSGKDEEVLIKASMTPERIAVEAAIETEFTPVKLANLLPKASAEGNKVRAAFGYAEVIFDFATGHVADKKVLRNVFCMGHELDTNTVLGLFALSLDGVTTQSTAEAKLKAAAPSLFEEPNTGYGERFDDSRHEAVIVNTLGIMGLVARNASFTSFLLNDKRTFEDVCEAGRYFWKKGRKVAFRKQVGAVILDDGAEALGVGRNKDSAVFMSDASRPSKVFDRPKLGARAIAGTVDDNGNSTIMPSGLLIRTSSGRLLRSYGTRIETYLTNSVLGPGSGVALARPGFSRKVRLNKTVSNTIPAINVEMVDNPTLTRADALVRAVRAKLVLNRGEIKHGETVFEVDGVPYGIWSGMGMACRVVGEPTITPSASSDSVTVSVKVAAEFEFSAHKVACDGVKATGLEYPITLTDLDGNPVTQPELLLTKEEIKGSVALLRAWADSIIVDVDEALLMGWMTNDDYTNGGVVYNPDTGLSNSQQVAYASWLKVHSFTYHMGVNCDAETVTVLTALNNKASHDAEFAKAKGHDHTAYRIGTNTTYQKIQVVKASMVLGIEISTVPENVTRQALIGEQLVALRHLDPELGHKLWAQAGGVRRAVDGLLDMAKSRRLDTTLVAGPVLDYDRETLKGRKLLESLRKQYPKGLTLIRPTGETLVTLHFGALIELGALLPGGSATGPALAALELLHHLHKDRAGMKNWDSLLIRKVGVLREGTLAWASTAKSSLGSITKSRKVALGMKVKTTFSPNLHSGQVGFNPNDPLVAMGAIVPGSYAMVERPPMISFTGGDVVLTNECPIGMVLVKAHLWAFGNEGDGDGDPAIVLFLKEAEMIRRIKAVVKASPFGFEGYLIAHGRDLVNHPYADFYAENAKKVVHGVTHQVTKIEGDKYLGMATDVGAHYSRFVGRTFAICSYLTYFLGTQLESTGMADEALEVACVLAWRKLYEGMGLSGFSPEAKELARLFGQIGRSNRIGVSLASAEELHNRGYKVSYSESQEGKFAFVDGVDATRYTWALVSPTELDRDVAAYLHRAILVTHAYSLVERTAVSTDDEWLPPHAVLSDEGEHLLAEGILEEALLYGMLRRGSKGLAVNVALGDESGNGLFRHVNPAMLNGLGNGIVSDMVRGVYRVQTETARIRQILEERE